MQNEVIAYRDGETLLDTQTAASQDFSDFQKVLFDNSDDALEVIRHSTAHMMAQAIKELYPNAKFFVGPVIEDGFYYDFRVDEKISDSDLKTIEKKMQEIAKRKLPIIKTCTTKKKLLCILGMMI